MKHAPSLVAEPPGLAGWRAAHPEDDQASEDEARVVWQRFKDSGHAYTELVDALLERQQGLCGYCEQRLTKADGTRVSNDYQVEHVQPKSGGSGRTLAWENLLACCGGGTYPHHRDPTRHRRDPRRGLNDSCGQTKRDDELPPGCDPRTFPWREAIVFIELDGRMRPDEAACARAGIDPETLRHAIDVTLDLNCERLRMAREQCITTLNGSVVDVFAWALELAPNLPKTEANALLMSLAGGRLRPDAHGHLCRFWSTERQYLGPPAEAWIASNAARLHFD
ncbi:MAG: TIGR02646 family protein [Myxococcales bacterium]|nr:TIGR02646 family protein [Myxococcales bacterium]